MEHWVKTKDETDEKIKKQFKIQEEITKNMNTRQTKHFSLISYTQRTIW